MDTSETYIEMCDCEEIQDKHKPEDGDWFHVMDYWGQGKEKQNLNFVLSNNVLPQGIGGDWKRVYIPRLIDNLKKSDSFEYLGIPFEEYPPRILIWLPRQDQLQEMIDLDGHWMELEWNAKLIRVAWHNYTTPFDEGFTSMEQMWLAFVMKEKFNKTWDGEGWK